MKIYSIDPAQGRLVVLSHNPFVSVLLPDDFPATKLDDPDLSQFSSVRFTQPTTFDERRWDTEKGLVKLILQVTHLCNLTCSYCCSDAGRWGAEVPKPGHVPFMEPDLARRAVRFFAERFRSIGTIYLFGGEPTLNLKAVSAVCDEAEKLVDEGVLGELPTIGLTTNGTIVNENFIRLLQERAYVKVSVSLDGPPHIHDHYRLDVAGKPTYNKIINNIRLLQDRTGQPSMLETTYNRMHQRSGLSLWETMEILHRDTNVGLVTVEAAYNTSYTNEELDPVLAAPEQTQSDFVDAMIKSMESISSSDDPICLYHVVGYSKVIFGPHKPGFCPAARNYFTVAKDGSIYPCQNLPENLETLIGRLGDPDLDSRLLESPILRKIDEANRNANEALGEEWFSNFCKICPVYNLSENHAMETLSTSRARLSERMAAAFVTQLMRIGKDESLYSRFLHNVQTKIVETFEPNVF